MKQVSEITEQNVPLFTATGLDFGAFDFKRNERKKKPKIDAEVTLTEKQMSLYSILTGVELSS